MNAIGSANRTARAIALATLELKLYVFVQALERRYAPDQPRVPAGDPDGGQWTSGGGLGGLLGAGAGGSQAIASRDASRIAMELTTLGSLHSQIRLRDGSLLCIYDFGLQHWMIPSAAKTIGCPALMTQSIFAYGARLNDNY